MPRAKYVNHKGRSRHFTSPEELEEQRKKKALKGSEEESSEEEEEESGSGEESSESEYEDAHKKKGVSGLIEIENPNRAVKKTAEKVSKIDINAAGPSKSELSRREREELEKQRAQAHYQKLHAEGKTEQARADLARLAIIKQHRAEAAARREAEKKERETKKGGKP